MRLIRTTSNRFTIQEFVGHDIPPYVILSHTWETEEVTLQDIQRSLTLAKAKRGFSKIRGCCDLARARGIEYAWIDTCCIDKTNSVELSEAINSMYQWYKDAAVCYAFLGDIPLSIAPVGPHLNREPQALDAPKYFQCSRWFSRGWTLQELIAPRSVEFYTKGWDLLGTRETLQLPIASATGIRPEVIREDVSWVGLSAYSVAERMSWAAGRTTTRIEDRAYCLLGIFNVNMPLIYSEGPKAFQRLQQEILKSQEDYSILAWGRSGGPQAIIEDIHCDALSSSPSGFGWGVHLNIQWNPESSVTTSKGGQEVTPPMSMTSRGLSVSVQLVCQTFGGRTFCLAILGYSPSGKMLCIPLREVGYGRIFTRLCVEDWGGFIYTDETDGVRKLPYTSIYIGQPDHYEVPMETLWDGRATLTVHTTNMNDSLTWMEPLPVLNSHRCRKKTMRPSNARVILTGNEMIFTGGSTVPGPFILRVSGYKSFILPCMTRDGTIFVIVLQTYGSYIIHYDKITHSNVGDAKKSPIDRLRYATEEVYKEIEDMRGIHNSKALVNHTFDEFHLKIRHTPRTVSVGGSLAHGHDVTISTSQWVAIKSRSGYQVKTSDFVQVVVRSGTLTIKNN
ncbi:heterokaryon incompatibility protein-domain-containing protein [Xylaria digitata]|nr:heterokaryon incompatibility protein-domain-containing protein [Xylaria digitata]